MDPATDAFGWLVDRLDAAGADYEVMEHAPTGVTRRVSKLRRHPLDQAVKCLMLMVRLDRKSRRHVLAVVPGDRDVDLRAVAAIYQARYVGFCDTAAAERLANAVSGAVLPFPIDPDVDLIVDAEVLTKPSLYFNAGRLDRSVRLSPHDYARIARPRTHRIATAGRSEHA